MQTFLDAAGWLPRPCQTPIRAIIALCAAALIAAVTPSRAQDDRVLVFFEPVRGALNDATPAEDWTFDGHANQVVSLLVVPVSGDLDPVLQVIGPDGQSVGENDDLDSLVLDAGLEAFALPADGTYTIRVARYQGADGTTIGEYELTITPGFGRLVRSDTFEQGAVSWVTPAGGLIPLYQEKLQMRVEAAGETLVAFPPDAQPLQNLYIQADVRLFGTPPYAEFGLVFRAQAGRSYEFKVNTDGQWTVVLQDESGTFSLRTWQSDPALAGSDWTLAVLARDDEFSFFANGVLLGALADARLSAPGATGVIVINQQDVAGSATILFDNVLVTTRLGSTYRGLPLALAAWNNDDPGVVVAELAESGRVSPAAARDLFVPDASLSLLDQNARFSLVGSEQAVYEDFILSAWLDISTSGESPACGVVYRWQDERSFDLAYVDKAGGFGVVQTRDALIGTNAYDLTHMVARDGPNNLLIVAQADRVTLYVNGALVTQETVAPGAGRVGVALLNYENARTDCSWSNLWVWPLEG